MATFTAIKNRGGGGSALGGVLHYVQQKGKTAWEDRQLVSGWNCTARSVYDEMRLTKEQFHKTAGRQYYHFVQSFDRRDNLSPQEVHAMGLELARREFPNFEVLVTTHVDTGHLHNHLVVNSVSFQDGKKLHQSAADLQAHRTANDEICVAHGLEILPPRSGRCSKSGWVPESTAPPSRARAGSSDSCIPSTIVCDTPEPRRSSLPGWRQWATG